MHHTPVPHLALLPVGVPARRRHSRGRERRGCSDDASDDPGSAGRAGQARQARQAGWAGPPVCHRRTRRHTPLLKLALLSVVAALALGGPPPPFGDSATRSVAGTVDVALAGVRDWVLANLEPSTALLVPARVAGDLTRHGHQADRLVVYGAHPASTDWRCCTFLITLGAPAVPPEHTLPPEAAPAYRRSRPVAAFGSDRLRAEIREILVEDMKVTRAAIAADKASRVDAAAALAKNRRLDLTTHARVVLLAGLVDARVLIALAGLTGNHAVQVAGFPVHPGEGATDLPRRAVQITGIDGRPVDPHDAATRDVRRFLMSQVPPYRPDALPVALADADPTLTVSFRAPSPIGLLAPVS